MKKYYNLIIPLLALQGSSAFSAVNVDIPVTASVTSICQLKTFAMDFGEMTASEALSPIQRTGNIEILCSKNTNYEINVDKGIHGNSVNSRKMKNNDGTESYLFYGLLKSFIPGIVLGEGPTGKFYGVGNGQKQNHEFYGILNNFQYVKPGSYADTLNVDVTY
jgi:hypothetical protein